MLVFILLFALLGSPSLALEEFFELPSFSTARKQKKTKSQATLEGASLQTVPEQELFKLRRAEEFAKEGDFRSAIALWQSVLDAAGSQLITRDDWNSETSRHQYTKYVTVAHEIESTLAGLSPEGLRAYRLRADGEARALLANPDGRSRMEVLSEVVRRFFLSSEGDEAAFELACLKLDRYEFTGASRLLKKCLEEHPDCSIPRSELLLRLALANGRIGDSESAEKALGDLPAPKEDEDKTDDLATGDLATDDLFEVSDAQRVQLVKADLSEQRVSPISVRDDWVTKFGQPDRRGTMPPLAKDMLVEPLTETWSQQFEVLATPASNNPQAMLRGGYGGGVFGTVMLEDLSVSFGQSQSGGKKKRNGASIDRKQVISQWSTNKWRPVSSLLFHNDFVYFKRENRVVCCRADTGEMEWMGFENAYAPPVDPARMMAMMMGQKAANTNEPNAPAEVQLFADHVHQSMSISDGLCYSIDGRTWMDKKPSAPKPQRHHPYAAMTAPARSRVNWITAYDALNGKLKWRRAAGEKDEKAEDSKFDIGFTAAPVSGAGMIYTTINDSGSVWLLALKPDSGQTIWKTFLGDEPAGSCSPWSPTAISFDGGDVYVGTGAGLVAAVDAVAGTLRWVVRYERSGKLTPMNNPYGGQIQMGSVRGWSEDVVAPIARALVVMASDSDEIFALDRRTGEVLWESPRDIANGNPTDYYLGSLNDRVFVAGKTAVRCYDAAGGRAIWEARIEKSLGHGFLTSEAIYVPSDKSIVKLSLEDGSELAKTQLVTTTQEPVGNLYSHDRRLFAVGMARVFSMMRLKDRIDDLTKVSIRRIWDR